MGIIMIGFGIFAVSYFIGGMILEWVEKIHNIRKDKAQQKTVRVVTKNGK